MCGDAASALRVLPPRVLERALLTDPLSRGALLRQAAADGSHDKAQAWLRDGATTLCIDAGDADGRTALYLAAEHNHTAVLEDLLASGAHMNQPDTTEAGDSALMAAARRGSVEATALLLECGVDWRQLNSTGSTALHLAQLHKQPVRKRPFLSTFSCTNDHLARQARGKHGENSKTDPFLQESAELLRAWLIQHGTEDELQQLYNQMLRRAAAVRTTMVLFVHFIVKRSFCQDRLGTNTGKALKKRTVLRIGGRRLGAARAAGLRCGGRQRG